MSMLGKDLVQAPYPCSDKHIRLIKPHGSLSWIHESGTDGSSVTFRDGFKPRLEAISTQNVHADGNFKQPLVLGAVPIKSELLEEIQHSQGNLHETISDQWRETMDALSRATEVVVVGYRFPPEDAYGRFLLREAIRKRPLNTGLPTISYYALPEDRSAVEEAFRDIFSSAANYQFMGKVEPPDATSG
jgi:hypothetical protein